MSFGSGPIDKQLNDKMNDVGRYALSLRTTTSSYLDFVNQDIIISREKKISSLLNEEKSVILDSINILSEINDRLSKINLFSLNLDDVPMLEKYQEISMRS